MYSLAALAVVLIIAILLKRKSRPRRYWVHPILQDRKDKGQFWILYDDLRKHPEKFFNYTRMCIQSFDELLQEVHDDLTYENTKFRESIQPCERLLLTLRYLATGHSYSSLHYEYRLGKSTIQTIVLTTCKVLWQKLQPKYLFFPDKKRWEEVAEGFWENCKFPNCVGAIDGKHVRIVCPPCSGSKYFNYKKFFSLVLLAIVDADYRFLYVDVGAYGSSSDSSVYANSKFGKLLQSGRLDLPDPKPLPEKVAPEYPFVFVGDEAFGLSTHIMRPYAHRTLCDKKINFNLRLSRARRMVECTFGIMATKWRVFLGSLQMSPDNAVIIIKAVCVLHNFVREKEGANPDDADKTITHLIPHRAPHRRVPRARIDAIRMRDDFADFFFSSRPMCRPNITAVNVTN